MREWEPTRLIGARFSAPSQGNKRARNERQNSHVGDNQARRREAVPAEHVRARPDDGVFVRSAAAARKEVNTAKITAVGRSPAKRHGRSMPDERTSATAPRSVSRA